MVRVDARGRTSLIQIPGVLLGAAGFSAPFGQAQSG